MSPTQTSNMDFEAKHARVKAALESRQPYWLLLDETENPGKDWYLALIQVGSDRVPVGVVLGFYNETLDNWLPSSKQLGDVIGYEPMLVLNHSDKINDPSQLIADIVSAMLESVKDDPNAKGDWFVSKDGQYARVTTRFSRNPSLSSNGGEYYFYRTYFVEIAGVVALETWSADFDFERPSRDVFKVRLTDLNKIFELAATVVKALLEGEKTVVCEHCGRPYTHPEQ